MKRVYNMLERYQRISIMAMLLSCSLYSSSLWAVEIPATTEWYQRIEITPLRSGIVERIPVAVGDRVKRGDLLLQLELEPEEAQRLLASKRLEQAKLIYAEAQREYERSEDLYERTLISEHDRAIGEAAWVGAAADLQFARITLSKAERAIRYSQIRAPFDALVVAKAAEVGAAINHLIQHPPLLTIVSATSIAVDGYVSQQQLAKFVKGATVQIKLAGSVEQGRVDSIAMEPASEKESRYRARLLIPYNSKLRAGMSAVILFD